MYTSSSYIPRPLQTITKERTSCINNELKRCLFYRKYKLTRWFEKLSFFGSLWNCLLIFFDKVVVLIVITKTTSARKSATSRIRNLMLFTHKITDQTRPHALYMCDICPTIYSCNLTNALHWHMWWADGI